MKITHVISNTLIKHFKTNKFLTIFKLSSAERGLKIVFV